MSTVDLGSPAGSPSGPPTESPTKSATFGGGLANWFYRFATGQTETLGRTLILSAIYLTPPLALTVPRATHGSSGFDTADLVKLLVLAMVAMVAGWYLLNHWYRSAGWSSRWPVGWPIALFGAFAGYGLLSVAWSALPTVTIDKAGTLGVLCVISMAVLETVRTRRDVSNMFKHLTISLLLLNSFIAIFYLYDPTLTGLDRLRIETGGDGIIHPTASGSTASLALVILLLCHVLWGFNWTVRFFLPAIVVHGLILIVSNSRMSILMLALTSLPWLKKLAETYISATRVSIAAIITAVAAMAIVLFDPGLVGIGIPAAELYDYVTRGQDSSELAQASGRYEMWQAIWGQILLSPWIGHGYFVTSAKGEITVWFVTTNHLSHNLMLQSLSTTGIIGTSILCAALASMIRRTWRLWTQSRSDQAMDYCCSITTATMLVWYAGWSLLASSFIGPLRPESLIFFLILGLVCVPPLIDSDRAVGPSGLSARLN